MEFSVAQIAHILKGEVVGDDSLMINNFGKIQEAKRNDITFLANPKYESFIYTTEAGAVIVSKDFKPKKEINATMIVVQDPYSSFTILLEEYQKQIKFLKTGVEEPSYIGSNCITGKNIYRGAFSYIGNNVTIGDNVKIYPQVYIGDNVKIGNNTILSPGVKIYTDCVIGSNCVLHAGVVVGSDGFGFAPQADGSYRAIPQLGNVVIKDNVDIGANTVIDCATLGSTIIHEGVKLDNLIQIGHNVEIGKDTVIAAQSGVSGSSKLGENCMVGGQVGVVGHLEIANKTTLAAQAGVMKSIKQEGTVILGSPAIEHSNYLRSYAVFKNLPELNYRVMELENKIKEIEKNRK